MENWLIKITYLVGASVCHQLPQRSFQAGNYAVSLCARCEGIYLGFLISAVILFIMFRKKENNLPPLYLIVILSIFFLSTIADGILSYLSLIITNNYSRFITGYFSGLATMTIAFPIFNFQYYRDSISIKIFAKWWKFIIFLALNAVFMVPGILNLVKLNLILSFLGAFAVIFTFFFVNLVLILMIPLFSRKSGKLFSRHIVAPAIISAFLAFGEIFVSYKFHQFLLNFNT